MRFIQKIKHVLSVFHARALRRCIVLDLLIAIFNTVSRLSPKIVAFVYQLLPLHENVQTVLFSFVDTLYCVCKKMRSRTGISRVDQRSGHMTESAALGIAAACESAGVIN